MINDYTREGVYGQRFTESGFRYNQTIVTLATLGLLWLCLLLVIAPLCLIIGLLLRKLGAKSHHGKSYGELFHLKIILSIVFLFSTISVLPTSIASILEITNFREDPDDSTHLDTYSYYCAITILTLTLLFIVAMNLFIMINRDLHKHELLRDKIPASTLYEPFKDTAYAL